MRLNVFKTNDEKMNWIEVKFREELVLGDEIRVRRTGHEAKISKVVDKDSFGQKLHSLCYHIEPRDPKDLGGHWFFSHSFDKKIKD